MSRSQEIKQDVGPYLVDIAGAGRKPEPGFHTEFRIESNFAGVAKQCRPEASGPLPNVAVAARVAVYGMVLRRPLNRSGVAESMRRDFVWMDVYYMCVGRAVNTRLTTPGTASPTARCRTSDWPAIARPSTGTHSSASGRCPDPGGQN